MTTDTKIAEDGDPKSSPLELIEWHVRFGMLGRASADDLKAALLSRDAEITRLRALVESAYREGWREGESEGLSAGQRWSGIRFDRRTADGDWTDSDARRALDAKGGG